MQCCFSLFLFFACIAFVEIRLSNIKDSKRIPKWSMAISGHGDELKLHESTELRFENPMIVGNPPISGDLVFVGRKKFYFHTVANVTGTPLSFHRLSLKVDKVVLREDVVLLNMNGQAYSEMSGQSESIHKMKLSFVHAYDGEMNQRGSAKARVKMHLKS